MPKRLAAADTTFYPLSVNLRTVYVGRIDAAFAENYKASYTPYLYAGMLFNISMAWLDDCKEPVDKLSLTIVNAIYFD